MESGGSTGDRMCPCIAGISEDGEGLSRQHPRTYFHIYIFKLNCGPAVRLRDQHPTGVSCSALNSTNYSDREADCESDATIVIEKTDDSGPVVE